MDRQAETAPLQTSCVLSTQFQCPPPCGQQRGSMPPPRRSSLPPLPPKRPTTTRQQYFYPRPRLPPHQSPVFGSWTPPMSPAPSSSSFRHFQSAPVAYHNAAFPPLPPLTRPPTNSVSANNMASYSDKNSAGLPDVLEMIYPEPIEMDLGVNYSREGPGGKEFDIGEPDSFMDEYVTANMDLDKIFDCSIKNDDVARISGPSENNWRNAGVKTTVPSATRKRKRSVLDCNNLNNENSSMGISKGVFTESQMNEIARSEKLIKEAVTNPKKVKRILSKRVAARRTHLKKEQYIVDLEKEINNLKKEVGTVTAHTSSTERTKQDLEEENKQMRIRIQEMEEQVKLGYALTDYYNEEINGLKQKETGEVIPNWETTMDDMMDLEQLKQYLDEKPGTNNYWFE